MNLYRIEYGWRSKASKQERVSVAWVGTQAAVKAKIKELDALDAYDIEWVGVEVPTDKPGLLAWLNEHFCEDRPES